MSLLRQGSGRKPRPRRRGSLSRIGVGALLLVQMAWSGTSGGGTGGMAAREYDMKAAFLFNFTHYVDWPPEAFPTPDAPFTICVLGEDPFGQILDTILKDERIGRRSVTARRCRDVDEVEHCQILFIPRSASEQLGRIFSDLSGKSILTVGEDGDSARRSAMIRFVIAKNRLRLRVNVEAAKEAGLTISSKLLRQVEIVRNAPER